MKVTPTSGPTRASITHHERDAISSHHPFFRSHFHAPLCEGKEDLLEIGRQIVADALARKCRERIKPPLGNDAAPAQEHETIADLCGIRDLMDGQEERAVRRQMLAERGSRVSALPQVETLERFVDEEDRLRRKQAKREQRAFALSL